MEKLATTNLLYQAIFIGHRWKVTLWCSESAIRKEKIWGIDCRVVMDLVRLRKRDTMGTFEGLLINILREL